MPSEMPSTMTGKGDLEGLLVVSVEQAVAAPYASMKLAEAGARVIKIERPEGDFARLYDADAKGFSSYFVWLNKGKESVCLNLKDAADKELLRAMIAEADIFIQNLMPGAFDRLGLPVAAMRDDNPRLITCSISGYGSDGPWSQMKAYDLLIQAETGLAGITGTPDHAGRVGVSICDIAAGMASHQAILQALYGRVQTGVGRAIEVSLFHALSDWMNVPYVQHLYGGKEIRRPGLHHPSIAPYGVYACGDGGMILLSIQNEREWARLCGEVLGDDAIATDPRFDSNINRVSNRVDLDEIMLAVFGRSSRDDMAGKLTNAGIAFGRLNGIDDLISHPQSRYITVRSSAGDMRIIAPGAMMEGMLANGRSIPDLGADTDAVRNEFS